MSKKQSGGSCFGLFVKSFFFSALALLMMAAGVVLIAVKGFDSDLALWTDFSSPTSRAWLSIYAVGGLAFVGAFLVATMGAIVSKVFGGKPRSKGSGGGSKPKSRPQSSRKTTV